MTMRLIFAALTGTFDQEFKSIERPISSAATQAVIEAGDIAKRDGRTSIAAAGFSRKWQNALRSRIYPAGGKLSLRPAAYIYHKIPYAHIFEEGGSISPGPGKLMWIPTENVPTRRGLHRMTPGHFVRTVGPLVSVNVPGKAPMLFAKADRGKRGKGKVTLAGLRRAASGAAKGRVTSVPLFIGVEKVTLRKRFDIVKAVQRVVGMLPALFLKHYGEK
jgi:hypothetical protein